MPENIKPNTDKKPTKLLAWEAPEFRYFEKSTSWFTGTIIVAVVLGLIALWQKNFLFLIFILIAEALVLYWGKQSPRLFKYQAFAEGILEDERKLYAYGSYQSFALLYDNRLAELILKPKKNLGGYTRILMSVELKDAAIAEVSQYLPFFEYEESFIEHLANRLRL